MFFLSEPGDICTSLDILILHLHKIFEILVKRGYSRGKLIKNIQVFASKYSRIFRKFGILDDWGIIKDLPWSIVTTFCRPVYTFTLFRTSLSVHLFPLPFPCFLLVTFHSLLQWAALCASINSGMWIIGAPLNLFNTAIPVDSLGPLILATQH